jgi:NitT/TauT family transport system substrate-binding protein
MSRRRFLRQASALGAASFFAILENSRAESPPETTRIRLARTGSICLAPQYVAEALLRLEGFTDVEYPEVAYMGGDQLTRGRADVTMDYVPSLVRKIDAGAGVVALAGVHSGCYAIIANQKIKSIRELRGTKIGVSAFGAGDHVFIASMLAYVGVNPGKDIDWVLTQSIANNLPFFREGKTDALIAFPPQPQKLRELNLGQVIVDGTRDRPWSQYICCCLTGSREFVEKHPVATKRALRAILKAADMCAQDPQRAAQIMVAKGFEPRYDIALEVLKDVPYDAWRWANTEDAIRFHALRLHEVGMIRSNPQKIIQSGTDWRFLNELKKEMRA